MRQSTEQVPGGARRGTPQPRGAGHHVTLCRDDGCCLTRRPRFLGCALARREGNGAAPSLTLTSESPQEQAGVRVCVSWICLLGPGARTCLSAHKPFSFCSACFSESTGYGAFKTLSRADQCETLNSCWG